MQISNYNDLKLLDKRLVINAINELCPDFEFKTKPWKQQAVSLLASILEDNGFLSALDLGTGKTKVAIDLCRFEQTASKIDNYKCFVVCLNSAMYNWANEVKLHSDMSYCVLDGTMQERWEKLNDIDSNFYIVNFEGFRGLFTSKVLLNTENKKYKLKQDIKKISFFWNKRKERNNFNTLIIDESHMLKNFKSLTFKLVKPIGRFFDNRLLLTGTPFGNTPHDVWSQYFLIDFGETFYKNITAFRTKYFKDVGYFGADYKVTKKGEKEIKRKLWTKAIRYTEQEIEDLPAKVYRKIEYKLSTEQRKAYKARFDLIAPAIKEKKSLSESGNNKKRLKELNSIINGSHTAFKQICSGFQGTKGNKYFKDNAKFKAIDDLLDSMIDNAKIVFFHFYTQEFILLSKLLKKKKIKFAHLNGATKDKWQQQEKFKNDESCRVMVAQTKVGGASINLISATYCAFISNHGSVIDRKQAEKRVHRGGQTKTCFYYDFVGKGTVEMKVYKNLQDGIDSFSKIIDPDELINLKEI